MKRSGFTMIELVFVIVILGILASVAIPKLAATRDDANIVKATAELSNMITDMGAFYTAKGSFETEVAGSLDGNTSKMTNVKLTDNATPPVLVEIIKVDASTSAYYTDVRQGQPCLEIKLSNEDGNVSIINVPGVTSVFCKGIQKSAKSLIKTHSFGGSSIFAD